MKKLIFIVPCVCSLLLFSCKKEVTAPAPATPQNLETAETSLAAAAVVQDTIPPANAVNVKTYGALGNGVHDDTKAIQDAINAQTNVVLTKGTYIINQSLVMRSGVRVYGSNGAIIKAGASISGKLLTQGIYFSLYNVTKTWIVNLKFQPSATKSFTLGAWANSAVLLVNSSMNDVKYNVFDFKQPYAKAGIEGVWLSSVSNYNYIGYNKLSTVGLVYEAGASGNYIIRNDITNSHDVAIGGYGNSTATPCKGNQVINNTITNAGYMGIEDYKNTDQTYIGGNVISGTGKSGKYTDGFGISSVGQNTTITLNNISDAQGQYVEVGGNSKIVTHNTINDTQGVADGFVVNLVGPESLATTIKTTVIDQNLVYGCLHAVNVTGNYYPSASITGNTFYNPINYAVTILSNATSYNVNIANNNIVISKPNKAGRIAIGTYANVLYAAQKTTISGNTITYQTGAAGGKGTEYAFLPRTNNVVLTKNKVVGNDIKMASGSAIIAISANTSRYTGYTITNNTFTGVFWDISGFLTALLSGNNF